MLEAFAVLVLVVIGVILAASFVSRPRRTNERQESSKDADV